MYSYLKFYTTMPISKLAAFMEIVSCASACKRGDHDQTFVPSLQDETILQEHLLRFKVRI